MANTFRVGDLEVLAVSDGEVAFPGTGYFAGTTTEQWEPHKRWLNHEGNIVFPFGCFVVRSGNRRVLIDTGVGPGDTPPPFKGGLLISELAAAGVSPGDIDTVFITHLHLDHCGTAAVPVDGTMQPAFPNATYRWTSAEQAHWSKQPANRFTRTDIFAAVAPRFEAADGGSSIAAGIDVVALPGHTPGHAGVMLSSDGQRAFVLGDAISCPAQLEEPEWSGLGDMDKNVARQTQEALLREIEGSEALLGASHFPNLSFGRVVRGEGRRYWQPV